MLDISNSTYTPSIEQIWLLNRPAEERSATDISSPTQFLDWLAYQHGIRTVARPTTTLVEMTPEAPKASPSAKSSDWLSYALATFEKFRDVKDDWDGEGSTAPTGQTINAAEDLSILLAPIISVHLPVCAIEPDGGAMFAARGKGFYLHLTVEQERSENDLPLLSWYAVINGKDYFSDEVEFSGEALPIALIKVLQSERA